MASGRCRQRAFWPRAAGNRANQAGSKCPANRYPVERVSSLALRPMPRQRCIELRTQSAHRPYLMADWWLDWRLATMDIGFRRRTLRTANRPVFQTCAGSYASVSDLADRANILRLFSSRVGHKFSPTLSPWRLSKLRHVALGNTTRFVCRARRHNSWFMTFWFLLRCSRQRGHPCPIQDRRALTQVLEPRCNLKLLRLRIYLAVCERAARTDAFPLTGAQSSS